MSKSDYWDEKEHEKYEKMKVGMEYDDFNLETAKHFSKITNTIIKIICIPPIAIGILTFIIVFLGVILYWKGLNTQLDPNVVKNMEGLYNEKFTIISKSTNEEGYTIFRISPKSNKNIIFTAYKKGRKSNNDYQSQITKYFIEQILDESIKEKLTIDEKFEETEGILLLNYRAYIQIENYEEIEDAVKLMYQIKEKAIEQKEKVYTYITSNSWLKINEYYTNTNYYSGLNLEELTKQEQETYLKYTKEMEEK